MLNLKLGLFSKGGKKIEKDVLIDLTAEEISKDGKKVDKEVLVELSDEDISAVSGGLAPPATIKTHDYDEDIKDKV